MSKEFSIKRKNLSEIKRLKEQVKRLKAEAPTIESKEQAPKESKPTEAEPAPAAEAEAEAEAELKPKKKKKKKKAGGTAFGNAIRYKKREDLNDTE